jgi:tRNA threonylcarbamoyl adenosine modification protein (Sua5/YciO/YrdC/YwlC family)
LKIKEKSMSEEIYTPPTSTILPVDDSLVPDVVAALKNGELVILPLENGYVLAADAFNSLAIGKINSIRGASVGTALQVIVGSAAMAKGVAADFDEDCQRLAAAFWPGALTLQLAPQNGLNWDLGDGATLGEFAIRVPAQPFTQLVLAQSGPLAIAIAAPAGQPAPTALVSGSPVMVMISQVKIAVDAGQLPLVERSTVIRRSVIGASGGLELLREGAISLTQVQEVIPGIELAIA